MNSHFRSQVRLSCDGKFTRNRANSSFHPQSAIVILAPIWEKASEIFADLDVNIVLTSRFLGGCNGNNTGIEEYVMDKVDDWVRTVSRLAEVAKSYPQSAHSAFTHSLSSQWTYLQ